MTMTRLGRVSDQGRQPPPYLVNAARVYEEILRELYPEYTHVVEIREHVPDSCGSTEPKLTSGLEPEVQDG
jgi:hypothetical protein